MPKNLRLRIDNPCAENWDQMRPEEQGRFCSSCQKTVVDFSNMSDQQVLSWLSRSGQSVCGRFYDDQLHRNLLPPPERKGKWMAFWQLLLAGLLVSSETSAQSPAARQEIVEPNKGKEDLMVVGEMTAARLPDPAFIFGRLVDSATNQPLIGASVELDHSRKFCTTDKDGRFRIDRKIAAKHHTLNITLVGYTPVTVPLGNSWPAPGEKTISMSIAAAELAPVTVLGYGWTKGKIEIGGAISIIKTDSVPQKIKDTLAVIGLAKKALTIYPNPVVRGASVTLSIRLDNPGVYSAQLYSASGALIETLQIEEKTTTALMNIPATLAAGVYFIKLSHPFMNKVYTQQLVVR